MNVTYSPAILASENHRRIAEKSTARLQSIMGVPCLGVDIAWDRDSLLSQDDELRLTLTKNNLPIEATRIIHTRDLLNPSIAEDRLFFLYHD